MVFILQIIHSFCTHARHRAYALPLHAYVVKSDKSKELEGDGCKQYLEQGETLFTAPLIQAAATNASICNVHVISCDLIIIFIAMIIDHVL